MKELARLYYIHDPMCSWCWGFHPALKQLIDALPSSVCVQYLLGGLAADSQSPMPEPMQLFLQQTWRNIQQRIPGTAFNFDFWTQCQPRRSTYPACRAVIAAGQQNPAAETTMIDAIQNAYYMQAKNPSDNETLVAIADNLKLDRNKFSEDLDSPQTQQQLEQQIKLARRLGAESFPSLVLQIDRNTKMITIDYNDASMMLKEINQYLASTV